MRRKASGEDLMGFRQMGAAFLTAAALTIMASATASYADNTIIFLAGPSSDPVSRNFFLGNEPTKGWGPFRRLDHATANRVALDQIRQMGIRRITDAGQLVGTISGGERQALAIAPACLSAG